MTPYYCGSTVVQVAHPFLDSFKNTVPGLLMMEKHILKKIHILGTLEPTLYTLKAQPELGTLTMLLRTTQYLMTRPSLTISTLP